MMNPLWWWWLLLVDYSADIAVVKYGMRRAVTSVLFVCFCFIM